MDTNIAIIADDLTGANDSGIQLLKQGIKTSVYFGIPNKETCLNDGIVIDTDSRIKSFKDAVSVTKRAGRFFLHKGDETVLYKKMDSTLRGHIVGELEALYEVLNPAFVVIAPAYPYYGRTTKNGIHYINGVELARTEVNKDPQFPLKESSILRLIENQTGKPAGLITLDDLRDNESFAEKMTAYHANQIVFVVCDAETEEDLQRVVSKMSAISSNILWAGSAGLAEAVCKSIRHTSVEADHTFSGSKRVMVVSGSLSKVTKRQIDVALEDSNVYGVKIHTPYILKDNWSDRYVDYKKECKQALRDGMDLVLYVATDGEARKQVNIIAKSQAMSDQQTAKIISHNLAELVSEIVKENSMISGLVLTGGDTAKHTVEKIGGTGIQLLKQIEPGIPLGSVIGSEKNLTIITKAGAFGNHRSIHNAIKAWKGREKE